MAGTLSSAVSSRLLPAPACRGAAVRAAYPRVEPELARLASYAPRGGTAVDVGTWYGPWTRGLRRIADRVVAVEPAPELARHVAAAYPDVRVVQAVGIRPRRHRRAVPARPAARESARPRWNTAPATPITVRPADSGRVWTFRTCGS